MITSRIFVEVGIVIWKIVFFLIKPTYTFYLRSNSKNKITFTTFTQYVNRLFDLALFMLPYLYPSPIFFSKSFGTTYAILHFDWILKYHRISNPKWCHWILYAFPLILVLSHVFTSPQWWRPAALVYFCGCLRSNTLFKWIFCEPEYPMWPQLSTW